MALLTYQVPHQYVPTLRNAQAEQIDKHDHVVAIRPRSQCLIANLIDEERDDHLRQTVRYVFAHRRYTYIK